MMLKIFKWLYVIILATLIITISWYIQKEPYAFTYSQDRTEYFEQIRPEKICTHDIALGKKCHMVNVPYGEENMWVFRDQSFHAKMVAWLYTNQLWLIGLFILAAIPINYQSLKRRFESWKKHTS